MTEVVDRRLCTAHSARTGRPCRSWAVSGATVCRMHGGSAPQVKAAAQRRLLAAVDPAAAKLVGLLDSEDETIRFRAANAILDRCGLGTVAAPVVAVSTQVNVAVSADERRSRVELVVAALADAGVLGLAGLGEVPAGLDDPAD